MKSKFEFFSDIIENKKLSNEQRERFFRLVSKELSMFDQTNENILRRIEELEKRFVNNQNQSEDKSTHVENIQKNEFNKQKKNDGSSSLPPYLNPKDLHDFLIEYNQDQVLKYTCHEIDNEDSLQNILNECKIKEYQFEKHLALIHKKYKKLSYDYKDRVLHNIRGLISNYLGTYNNLGWSAGIKINWSSPELLEWSKKNKNKIPNSSDAFQNEKFRFSTIELKNGEIISDFSQLVIYFKNLFHFKGTNLLRKHIEDYIFLHYSDNSSYKIEFDESFSNKIELFTYSEALLQAIKRIIDTSKRYHKNDSLLKVKLFFNYDLENRKELRVVILNAKKFGKNFNDITRFGDDFKNLIEKQINGLCDFYIKAYFEDKESNGLVNIWNGKPIEFFTIKEDIEGVEFILKMY